MSIDVTTIDWLIIAALVAGFSRLAHHFGLFSALAWPGTVAHEASHWIIASLLNGKPGRFTVWPQHQGNVWTLGMVVTHNPTWFNQAPIALAPLLWLPGCYFVYEHYVAKLPAWSWPHFAALYLLAAVIHGAIPSQPDWKIALQAPIPLFMLLLVPAVMFYRG